MIEKTLETKTAINPFDVVKTQIDRCADILNLDPDIVAILKSPMRELHVSLPVHMDDGSVKVFQGFRVQHNDARGITKGGIRFHPEEIVEPPNGRGNVLHRLWTQTLSPGRQLVPLEK